MPETTQGRLTIFVNGRAHQIAASTTIGKLAVSHGLDPRQLLVELNTRTLLRDEWPERTLEHGDRIEFIRVVAGG
jgi:thiamine biosynthesis protein ThiS